MVPNQTTLPNTDEIRRDFALMTEGWDALDAPVRFELRAFKQDAKPQIATFAPDWIDEAVEWCEQMNELGFNIYSVRNPIHADTKGSASDKDIVAAFWLWADCDDDGAAQNVRRFDGPKVSAIVVTGQTPTVRVHTYWRLAQPCTDMAEWRAMQESIAAHFGSDRTVVNPSRIMRVAGTVTYPDTKKQARGYVKELTALRTYDDRPAVTLEQMRRVFGASQPAAKESASSFQIDTGPQPLDRERTRIQALQGQEWHNAVIRLVASYVSKGLSDDEIHGLTDPLTLPGYTVEETRREVQSAINGARRKGWTPEEQNPFVEMTEEEKAEVEPFAFRPWVKKDLSQIPHPEFVYSDFYARGYTSLTLAAPKVGKSMLGLAEALDMATGKGFLTGQKREPLRVVYYNAEDDQDVIDSRVSALLTQYGIDQSEIEGRFWPTSGVDQEDFFLISGQDGIINESLFVALEKFCIENKADVLIFDPLQDLSRSPETNEVFRLLGQRIRRLANTTAIALGLIHHTRKVAPGMTATIDDGRGGSALRGTARFNRILNAMTEDEAAKAGLDNHRHFFRIGDMESNLAPPSADVNRWFEKVSVLTPSGREVGAVKPWKWPDVFDGVTPQQAAMVKSAIDQMADPPRADVRSSKWAGEVVGDVLGINIAEKIGREKVKGLISGWVKTDVLRITEAHDKRAGRAVNVIVGGSNNPLDVGGQGA